jgi:hypothetical protein
MSQTGPKTQEGKSKSAKNSLKFGIFSSVLLPSEDKQAVEAFIENLKSTFALSHGAGEVLASRYAHTSLQLNRLQQAQLAIAEGKRYSNKSREKFCIDAGMYYRSAEEVPDWYFNGDQEPRTKALFIESVNNDAYYLKNHYSPDLMTLAKTKLPFLWEFVMGEEGDPRQKAHTFGTYLGAKFGSSQPQTNIQSLIKKLEADYKYELLWAQNLERFEAIIRALDAQAILDTMTDVNLVRAESLLHRRSQELLSTMHQLKQSQVVASTTTQAKEPQLS